jgi:hypothetical protein
VGRVFIEFFRPDQPKIGDLGFSYSALIAALMAVTGAILLMARYKAINLKATENWEDEYQVGGKPVVEAVEEETTEGDVVEEVETPRVRRTTRSSNVTTEKKTANKTTTRKPTKEASAPPAKNKKS